MLAEEIQASWIEATHFSEGWLNRWNIIRQTRALETDILHITGDIHFAALAWPKWRRNRPQVVLTIHDIGFIHDHTGWKRWLMKKIWITWPLRCVDQLITVSEATKEAVLKEALVVSTAEQSQSFPRWFRSISNRGILNRTTPNPSPCTSELPRTKTLRRHAEALQRSGCSSSHHWRALGRRSSHVEAIGS